MHGRERAHHERDNNRIVRPFEWGLSFISDVNGDGPALPQIIWRLFELRR